MNPSKLAIPKQIWLVLLLAVLLVLGRTLLSGSVYFLYLFPNMFLSFLPYAVSLMLLWFVSHKRVHPAVVILGGIVWLVLFPNAPYIVTDMIHLKESHAVALWYDALMLFTCGWAGMLLAVHSLSHIEEILRRYFSQKIVWFALTILILLSSFGIYLGRLLRWNSWDVLVQPQSLFSDIVTTLAQPSSHGDGFLITIVFFFFIGIAYLASRPQSLSNPSDK